MKNIDEIIKESNRLIQESNKLKELFEILGESEPFSPKCFGCEEYHKFLNEHTRKYPEVYSEDSFNNSGDKSGDKITKNNKY
ncbi:hypothetical protein BHU72_01970 [Desulfuribacillus stibiiarsenatis]|uniref:Uncharacterized protein n=1 Tax=Desulfuribacillus stibiiarsenatis TaxID=1390249 RepID=A0A1E5L634_9FIRM|nr:hypothetical protein [Desulfuribacillus stibiiarsenatis]OEH85590.1 hypothetical protein BHU72_01970 [Desulfuribacillus stibiiarsenatis]